MDKGGFFSCFQQPPKRKKLYRQIKAWFQVHKSSFSLAVYLSLAWHFLILMAFVIPSFFWGGEGSENNLNALTQAVMEISGQLPSDFQWENMLTGEPDLKILEEFNKMKISGLDMSKDEKVRLFKEMLNAYIELQDESLEEDAAGQPDLKSVIDRMSEKTELDSSWKFKAFPSRTVPNKSDADWNFLTRKQSDKLAEYKQKDTNEKNYYLDGNQVRTVVAGKNVYVPEAFFFREPPYEEIMAEGAGLFYIVSGFPLIDDGFGTEEIASQKQDLPGKELEDKDFQVSLVDASLTEVGKLSFQKLEGADGLKVFKGSEQKINQILDALMVYPEEEQLSFFRRDYLEKYDLDKGDLAWLTKEFIQNNLSNVIVIANKISAAFGYIEEIYFNKPLDYHFLEFWRLCADTQVGTEFLLYIASHYDFERRALQYLFKANYEAKVLLRMENIQAEILDTKPKCYVITEVYKDLMQELYERGYNSEMEAVDKYQEEEEKIYRILIRKEGRVRNIGRYALGCLYWDNGQHDLALEEWQQIDADYSANKPLQDIREILKKFVTKERRLSQINYTLSFYSGRGTRALLDRLLQYGRWEKRQK